MISTSLNQINSQRQLLRVFGGLNEGYACSEAELSKEKNFSSRGYPALETRKPRRKVRQATGMNGMYHLNGLVTVEGTTLRYAPDDGGDTVELKDALTDGEKKMVGMGSKVLIWPDKTAFDTAAGTLSALGSGWQQGGRSLTVTPCDAAGVVYTPNKFGATEPESPKNGDVWLKQAEDAPWSYRDALRLYSTAGGWQNILLNYCRVTCEGLGKAFKAGDTVTLTGIPGVVKNDNAVLEENVTYTGYSVEYSDDTNKNGDLIINYTLPCAVPIPVIHLDNNGYAIRINGNTMKIKLPLITDNLRLYYSDYKNYYYLPYEDTAIHKSVAAYVDAECKVKATRETAYTKKFASFIKLPCYNTDSLQTSEYIFRYEYNDANIYLLYDKKELPEDIILQAVHILITFFCRKTTH